MSGDDEMEQKSGKSTVKKVFKIIVNVLLYLFFALCIFLLVVTVTAKKDKDGALIIFGHEMRIVVSPSMEKNDKTDVSGFKIKDIPVHAMVFIECVPEDTTQADDWYSRLAVGDVLTIRYEYAAQTTITHRIISIEKNEGGYTIELAGDNESYLIQTIDTSNKNSPNYVIGKVTYVSTFIGYAVYAVSQPVGMVFIIIVPCVIIIILNILRIISAATSDKRKKEEAERAQKDDEIEELKRRLAELEKSADGGSSSGEDND